MDKPQEVKHLEDEKIIGLYRQRDEAAIRETKTKYGRYCYAIAYNVLHDREDAEECENDTYLLAWDTIPPVKPKILSAFLGTITRRIALDKWRKDHADKRGGGDTFVSLCELEECVPSGKSIDDEMDAKHLAEVLSSFLRSLPETDRNLFLRRYWYFDSIEDIASRFGFGQSKVKMNLKRTKDKLRIYLEKEGILI